MPDYEPIFQGAAKEWNLDPLFLKAVASQESGGDPNARSKANAQGLMQIIPSTQRYLGVTDPADPVQSIYGGAKYLSEALDHETTPEDALRYYHGGPNWRSAYGPESQAYVPGIAAKYKALAAAQSPAAVTPPPESGDTAVASAKVKERSGDDILEAYMRQAPAPNAAPAVTAAPSGDTASTGPGDDILEQYRAADAPAIATAQQAVATNAADAPTSIPAINNLWAGVKHGASGLYDAGVRLAARADDAVPALARLDANYGLDPRAAAAAQPAAEAAYQAKYGNSGWAAGGNILGQAATTAPLMMLGGAGVGAAGGAVAEGLGGVATMAGRGIQAGADLLTGTSAAPGAGWVGNALARGTGAVVNGGVTGAGTAAITGGDIREGAETGAVAGPVLGTVGAGAGVAGQAVKSMYKKLTSGGAAREIEDQLATNRAEAIAAQTFSPPVASNPTALLPPAAPGTAADNALAVAVRPAPTAAPLPSSAAPEPAAAPQPATPEASGSPAAAPPNPATPAAQGTGPLSAEMNRFQRPPQGPNDKTYVKGVTPTEAELVGHPNTSRAQAVIYDRNPAPFDKIQDANTDFRIDHYKDLSGDADTKAALEDARSARAQANTDPLWAKKQDVDAQPIQDYVNRVMAGPDGKLSPVRNALKEVSDALQKSDGSGLENDPQMLYGARRQISFMMSKKGQLANPSYGDDDVIRALKGAQTQIDAAIEPKNAGYRKFMDDYAEDSKPISTQEVLQKAGVNIATRTGMTFNNVNRLLGQIVTKRQAGGISKEADIDPQTMEGLFNLRDDLARKQNIDLGKSRGSGTNQNEAFADAAGVGAAHLLAAHVPFGNTILENQLASVKARKLDAWTSRLTNPSPLNIPTMTVRPNNPLAQGSPAP